MEAAIMVEKVAGAAVATEEILHTVNRWGSKTFMDVPLDNRKRDLESLSGKCFTEQLPERLKDDLVQSFMYKGLESAEALRWLRFITADGKKPFSVISNLVMKDPYNPRVFLQLYGEKDIESAFDRGYVLTPGADGIYQRLQSLINRLPQIIFAERERLSLKRRERYIVFDIGAGHCLAPIYVLKESKDLQKLVKFVCIDPDVESIAYGMNFAKRCGLNASCIEFVNKKIQSVPREKAAHMVLLIGMFCPTKTRDCVFVAKTTAERHLKEQGLVIFSTVQEKMLFESPLLDFIMWSGAWPMHFKKNEEPEMIASLAGLSYERDLSWSDPLGFNRMTVGRITPQGVIKRTIGILKTLSM